jgi:hypothetical protein
LCTTSITRGEMSVGIISHYSGGMAALDQSRGSSWDICKSRDETKMEDAEDK